MSRTGLDVDFLQVMSMCASIYLGGNSINDAFYLLFEMHPTCCPNAAAGEHNFS